ncbi:MAG: hypothetical protein QOE23_3124 [Pseudonocardiales bacterium]|nr:hypothetical protein [Pseudonocardiales bacterium]
MAMNGHSESTIFAPAEQLPLEADLSWPVREDLFSTESGGEPRPESEYASAVGFESGFESPYPSGHEQGFESEREPLLESGLESGTESSFESGFESGFETGLESGYESPLGSEGEWQESVAESGFESGLESGYETGLESGYESGLESGYETVLESGFEGLASGLESGYESPYGSPGEGQESLAGSGLENTFESGLESGLESGYETGLENTFESGFESPYESSEDSALASRLGGTDEDGSGEDTVFESGLQQYPNFEEFAGERADESVQESPFEWAVESSAGEAPQRRPVPRHVVAFVNKFRRDALASQAATSVPALVILGQAALESGWGRRAPGFNFFGIKARPSDPPAARQLITTREVLSRPNVRFPQVISVTKRSDGRYDYVVKDWFRRYPSAAAGFAAHGRFLRRNSRYAAAFGHTRDPYAFARAVAAAGYATDPSYASALTSVMRLIARVPGGTRSPSSAPPAGPAPSGRPAPSGPVPSGPPAGIPTGTVSVPIPALPAPASPCLTGSDAPSDRALRAPDPGTGRFDGIAEIATFAAALARVHAQRLGTDAARREAELADDYASTMKAAMSRYGAGWRRSMQGRVARRRNELQRARRGGQLTAQDRVALEAVRCGQETWWLTQLNILRRGWMVGRREQLDFQTLMPKVGSLGTFVPPSLPAGTAPSLTAIAPLGTGTPITAQTRDFLAELRRIAGSSFEASNYAGHGGGAFLNRGYSLDLFLPGPLDDRGFYPPDKAVAFLGQVAAAARAVNLRWRVLYNDFRVAAEVNGRTGVRHVHFIGESRKGLNWHGPLILHFHLDLAP